MEFGKYIHDACSVPGLHLISKAELAADWARRVQRLGKARNPMPAALLTPQEYGVIITVTDRCHISPTYRDSLGKPPGALDDDWGRIFEATKYIASDSRQVCMKTRAWKDGASCIDSVWS